MARNGISGKDYSFFDSLLLNGVTYNEYTIRLLNIALARFKWENVPTGIDIRYLELMLITQGSALFFYEDSIEKYLGLGVAYTGPLDYYGVPSERSAVAANGRPFRTLDETNSVLIFNNMARTGDLYIINEYARKLYEIQRNAEVNADLQKFSSFISCNEKERLSLKNLMMKVAGGQPFIFGDKSMNLDSIKPINLDVPFIARDLLSVKTEIYNEALTSLGVVSVFTDKRERLVANEAAAPFGSLEMIRESYLYERKQACDKINEMFGLNITVEFNSEIPIVPESVEQTEETEAEFNG